MKRLLLPLAVVGLVGCGVQNPEVPGSPNYEALLDSAWARYAAGYYEEAAATFDSVLVVDAYSAEAHLGKGFSLTQLGDYSGAHGSFSVVTVLKEAYSSYVDTFFKVTLDTSALGDLVDTSWFSQVSYEDTLGVWRFKVQMPGPLLGVKEFTLDGAKQLVIAMDTEYVYIASSKPPFSDTTEHTFAAFLAYYRSMDISDLVWYAFIGQGTVYYLENTTPLVSFANLRMAHMSYGSLEEEAPDRVKNALVFDLNKTVNYEAYLSFKLSLFPNAVWALHQLDPSWPTPTWDIQNPDDFSWAIDPSNFAEIIAKIEEGF